MLEKYKKIKILKPYLDGKLNEIEADNQSRQVDLSDSPINGRRLTNIGTFRAYIKYYLEQNEQITQKMTFLIRQLQSGPEGLPIEIYVFSKDIRWAHYEDIQADIFDHIFSVVPEFDLKLFQYNTRPN